MMIRNLHIKIRILCKKYIEYGVKFKSIKLENKVLAHNAGKAL